MKRLFFLMVICCIALVTTAQLNKSGVVLIQTTAINIIVAEQLVNKPVISVQKKRTLKERLQVKLFQNILKKKAAHADAKKAVKVLGLFSILASLMGPFTLLLAFVSASPGIFVAFGIAFSLTAVILGLLSLTKRKALADKTGTSNVAAWIGIVFGGLFVIALASLYAFVNF